MGQPRSMRVTHAILLATFAAISMGARADALVEYRITDGQIAEPLTKEPGNPARGKNAALSREGGNCFLCHAFPDAGDAQLGNLGPPLAGVGTRMSAGQMRLRLVDSTRINRASIMPAYYRVDGFSHVASNYAGKPLLSAQQVEDMIAYLLTLR